ncbi:hypothetical protein BJV82DRAFT_669620 [Fennellomyces sp. T-0311]|nr:hypothetical protein BJV82DRAFT_669620 [Fennellomyces sp. T-0311]
MDKKVYQESNNALDTLSSIWDTMLTLLRAITEASNNSLRAEPDLVQLQKHRKDLDALLEKLKTQASWLQQNKNELDHSANDVSRPELDRVLQEQNALRQESIQLSEQLKRLLSQSYALQFQMDMLLASCHDQALAKIP